MPGTAESRKTLELFVAKAFKLTNSRYATQVQQPGGIGGRLRFTNPHPRISTPEELAAGPTRIGD